MAGLIRGIVRSIINSITGGIVADGGGAPPSGTAVTWANLEPVTWADGTPVEWSA